MLEPTRREGKKLVIFTIMLALILVIADVSIGWYLYIRPWSIVEVMELQNWSPGTTRDLEGTITGIWRVNTTYGPAVFIELDDYDGICNNGTVLGDVSKEYELGDRFRTTLHFTGLTFNGNPVVWAPELICPFPALFWNLGIVNDAYSWDGGFLLRYQDTDEDGWTTYEVIARGGDRFPLEVLFASLKEGEPLDIDLPEHEEYLVDSAADWIVLATVEYVAFSSFYESNPVVDTMDSLSEGVSKRGRIKYADVNENGYLDDGDRIEVLFSTDTSGEDYEMYFLTIEGPRSDTSFGGMYAFGIKYVLNGPQGPYELLSPPECEMVRLDHVADEVNGNVTSIVEVGAVRWGTPTPYSDVQFRIVLGDSDLEGLTGNFSETPVAFESGIRLDLLDDNGLLDEGDRFVIGGLPNRTRVDLGIFDGRCTVGESNWFTGYGHVTGRLPDVELVPDGLSPCRIDVNVSYWHQEFALNRTLTVSLQENSTVVLDNVSLSEGLLGVFENGTLSFVDADGDGFLSSGDYFLLQGSSVATYRLEISVLFGYRTYEEEVELNGP